MNFIVEFFLNWLPRRFHSLVLVLLLDYLRLVVTVYQIAIYLFVDLVFRWTVSKVSVLVPSISSGVDRILARLKLAPLNTFPPGHYPRLQAIVDAIQKHLQNQQNNRQVVEAFQAVLIFIRDRVQDHDFPDMTLGDIRTRFTDNWPRISPLEKASCLYLAPTGIRVRWGLVRHFETNEPTIWINPYLVQALEAVQEGSDVHAYLQFLTIVTILHEAMHLIVQIVSPGTLTPGNGIGESGHQLEMMIFQNTILEAEMRESDVFHLTQIQRLLLSSLDESDCSWILTGQRCRQAVDRFLRGGALWIDEFEPVQPEPHQALLTRINLVETSSTLIRLRSSPSKWTT